MSALLHLARLAAVERRQADFEKLTRRIRSFDPGSDRTDANGPAVLVFTGSTLREKEMWALFEGNATHSGSAGYTVITIN